VKGGKVKKAMLALLKRPLKKTQKGDKNPGRKR